VTTQEAIQRVERMARERSNVRAEGPDGLEDAQALLLASEALRSQLPVQPAGELAGVQMTSGWDA
jgi:hypothetical protein